MIKRCIGLTSPCCGVSCLGRLLRQVGGNNTTYMHVYFRWHFKSSGVQSSSYGPVDWGRTRKRSRLSCRIIVGNQGRLAKPSSEWLNYITQGPLRLSGGSSVLGRINQNDV